VGGSEEELNRVKSALPGRDLLTIKALITIENFKNTIITLSIHRVIMGELLESNVPWRHSSKLKMWDIINRKNDTSWDLTVKEGEKRKIEYTYKIYIWR
jgi:hypothetical protein